MVKNSNVEILGDCLPYRQSAVITAIGNCQNSYYEIDAASCISNALKSSLGEYWNAYAQFNNAGVLSSITYWYYS